MKKLFLLFALLGLTVAANAQTKRIAHRSHSGSNATFTVKGEGNFGEFRWYPPVIVDSTRPVDSAAVDSMHKSSVLYHQIPGTGIAGAVGRVPAAGSSPQ